MKLNRRDFLKVVSGLAGSLPLLDKFVGDGEIVFDQDLQEEATVPPPIASSEQDKEIIDYTPRYSRIHAIHAINFVSINGISYECVTSTISWSRPIDSIYSRSIVIESETVEFSALLRGLDGPLVGDGEVYLEIDMNDSVICGQFIVGSIMHLLDGDGIFDISVTSLGEVTINDKETNGYNNLQREDEG